MAAAASTALLRSLATKMARRPGPGPACLSSRRFSSSPTGTSTPPATSYSKDATRNEIDLNELKRAGATFLNKGQGFDAFDMNIQGNCGPMERQIEAKGGVPRFSASQSTQSSASSSK